MKKLMLLVAACLVMVACNNKPAEVTEETTDSTAVVVEEEVSPCCQMMKDWADFDNKTVEEQTAMIEKRGECITKKLGEIKIEEIQCPNAQKELTAFVEKWNAEFANADVTVKKALLDEFDASFRCLVVKEDKCCKKEGKGCDKKCEGNCEGKCDKKCGDECKKDCKKDCKHDCKK